jgi:predicted nucleotide-binding protein
VHGHDELAKQKVARFVDQLDLTPVILHEQPSEGKTVIEKLETHSAVDFAVVLLTPDDVGYPADQQNQAKPRARQNVILELGLFLGTLGRNRVCALYKGNVEIPSDYLGVVYVQMDDAEGWKLSLAREIRQAGVDVDLNKVI